MSAERKPAQSIPVFRSDAFRVTNGANLGDGLGFADELVMDDIYGLSPVAQRQRLSVRSTDKSYFVVASDTQVGTPGGVVHLDCCATFMSGDGQTTEIIVMVEVDGEGDVVDTYILPLAPLDPNLDYALVGINQENPRKKFAQVACVSFTRGTRITMVTGEQRPIEELKVGDKVLTRDDGAQEIRWIGQTTVRAVGDFAPIVITKGTLNNINELVVSPDHRLFIYQRTDTIGAGRAEVLVKARHLVNDETVYRQDGGFVDYFQLLFDDHQIIYAEGIAAESLLVDTRTRPVLPRELSQKLAERLPGHENRPHLDFEVQEGLIRRPDAAELLRRSSSR